MLTTQDVFLLSVGYVLNVLDPKEKKQLKEWRSQLLENESLFQDMIDPKKRKARWEEAEAHHYELKSNRN